MPNRTHPPALLSSLAHLLDAACHDRDDHVVALLRDSVGDAPAVDLSLRVLPPGTHPCDELKGFVAPPECWGVGLVVHGRAHLLDAPDRPPQRVVSTFLRHRDGRTVSLLRRDGEVCEQRGPVEGRIPDLCRWILEAPGCAGRTGS